MQSKDSRFSGFVPALLVAGCLASPSAAATTGTISFDGQITDSTCDVTGGTTGTSSFVVQLPVVSTNQLGPGDVAGRTNFRMSLANCMSVANGVRVFFEGGPTVDPGTGTLTTSLPDVNLALFNKDGSQIAIGNVAPAAARADIGLGPARGEVLPARRLAMAQPALAHGERGEHLGVVAAQALRVSRGPDHERERRRIDGVTGPTRVA